MAEQSRILSAAFPTPPPFYKSFTKENLAQLKQRQRIREDSENDGLDVLALPHELRQLIPPKPPTDGRYRSFGIQHDVCVLRHCILRP